MSYHKHIRFDLTSLNWSTAIFLKCSVGRLNRTSRKLKTGFRVIHRNMFCTRHSGGSPSKCKAVNRDVYLRNKELTELRREARRLFDRTKSIGHWENYRRAFAKYNKKTQESHCFRRLFLKATSTKCNWRKKNERSIFKQPRSKYQCATTDTLSRL